MTMRHRLRRSVFGALAGAAVLAVVAVLSPDAPPVRAAPAAEDHGWAPDTERQWMGVATCASMACHHENGPTGAPRSEYSTWAAEDPHARAFRVLYEARSEGMVKALHGKAARPATETELCLKCHASYTGKEQKRGPRFFLGDGVGCESCHGPAQDWLSVHYQSGFKDRTTEEKAKLGLRPTKNLVHRAKLCAGCHVGDADREVNHDLIAAGHPRLNFELSGYHAVYPRHWPNEGGKKKDFEARLWLIGQATTSRAAVALLKERAEGAKADRKPWPEFAEHDCFACHRRLSVDSPSQQARWEGKGPARRPGALPWGAWYASAPLAQEPDLVELAKLRDLMQQPSPDEARVAEQAGDAAKALDAWLGRVSAAPPMTEDQARTMLRALVAGAERRADSLDWDETTQLYLAVAALHAAWRDLSNRPLPPGLTADVRALGLRLKSAFPVDAKGRRGDSPTLFDPLAAPKLSRQFEAIRRHLDN
jgi:hypothetical protein